MIRFSDIACDNAKIMEKIEQELNMVETVNDVSKTIEITNETLPIIKEGDKKVLLCVKDTYKLYMMPVMDSTTMIIEGCKFYLENEGRLMIGAEHELSISKDMLIKATDHTVLSILNKYALNFTEDDLKRAFERARMFVEKMIDMASHSSSLNIQETYAEVIRYARDKAAEEKYNKGLIESKCRYNPKERIVSIRDSFLQTVLDEIESGYTKIIFCKKLALLAQHYGKELMISNKGRYTFNETGNVRWYKLRVVDEWLDEDKGGAA